MKHYNRVALLTCLVASSAATAAHAAVKIGWLWADQPSATGAYTPSTSYSYNSAGGAITVTPTGTGTYRVDFGDLYSAGHNNVQVSAYSTNGYCVSAGWDAKGAGDSAEMYVSCYDASGNPANSYFTLLYQDRTASTGTSAKGIAFVWGNQPTAASYTPTATYSYNSTGGVNTIVRNGVGNYTVTVPGLTTAGGDVQVTAYDAPARCKSGGWTSDSSATYISVECYNHKGAAADEYFSLAFALNAPFALDSSETAQGAYAWAEKDTDKGVYTPVKPWNFSSFGTGKMTSQKASTGAYSVNIPGSLSYSSSLVLVTGYDNGTGSDYCNVVDWFPIAVQCYRQGGKPIDSDFDVTFQTAK